MPYNPSYRGGGRGRSGGRDGGGRGRGGRGGGRGGGGRYHSGRGGRGGGDNAILGHPIFTVCRNFLQQGNCNRGDSCTFGHSIQIVSDVPNSNKDPSKSNNQNNYNNNYNNYNDSNNNNQNQNEFFPTTDISLWLENQESPLKIFTSSHDGHWRLYNTANGQFQKEVEHNMNGKVNTILVKHNFLFCGFESQCVKIPKQSVGFIFAWNLTTPGEPPMELQMGSPQLAPYAHSKGVSSLITHEDICISGGQDHIIRVWKYDPVMNTNKGGFQLIKTCCGHVGEVSAMVFLNGMLWSASVDGTIRLWDSNTNWECKHLISGPPADQQSQQQPQQTTSPQQQTPQNGASGHINAITALIPFQSEQGTFILSSSLDGNIKIWNSADGNCLSTTAHGDGILSMAISKDLKGHDLLICGTIKGDIIMRGLLQTEKTAPMTYLCSVRISRDYAGHNGPVYSIVPGPPNTIYANTFYTAGDDGKMLVWQIAGDLGMS